MRVHKQFHIHAFPVAAEDVYGSCAVSFEANGFVAGAGFGVVGENAQSYAVGVEILFCILNCEFQHFSAISFATEFW